MILRECSWSVLLWIASASLARPATAQCLDWKDSFEFAAPGVTFGGNFPSPIVSTMLAWDDGTGPALYAGGYFTVAGGVPAHRLAKWNGSVWAALPGTLPSDFSRPHSMVVFDDGSGPALYVGGFSYDANAQVLRWDGSSWSPLGFPGHSPVNVLAVFDDGSGPALYSGGGTSLPPTAVSRWTGSGWAPLGSGLSGGFDTFNNPEVRSLAVFDDGSGSALFVGGTFANAGGTPVSCIAKWNGSTWSDVGGGLLGGVSRSASALTVFDDGGGPRLYAGGIFSYAGGNVAEGVASWDGTAWSAVGAGPDGYVNALAVSDASGSPALYAVGSFGFVPNQPPGIGGYSMSRWDGSSWTQLGGRLRKPTYDYYDSGAALCVASFDDGSGATVYCGGDYLSENDNVLNAVARWDGSAWARVGPSTDRGMNAVVDDLEVLDLGGGASLYAAGAFKDAGGKACQGIARWTGAGWSPLGDGMIGEVYALAAIGSTLYAGGSFGTPARGIARWDGSSWIPVFGGLNGTVSALLVRTEAGMPALYAGGSFIQGGGIWPRRLARWNGSQWSPLGTGVDATVYALASFDDGTGSAVIAGGAFVEAGGSPANHVAVWNGATWSTLGAGLNGTVHALLTFDDGSGTTLYVGGDFTTAGGAPANRIARWNGTSWSTLGLGFDGTVLDLAVHDDGNGPALYASGSFDASGSVTVHKVARWNGTSWRSPGSGAGGGSVIALASFDDGTGGGTDLWAGGDFASAATIPSSRIGAWRGCSEPVSAMCYGDGTVAPCPCGNQGVFRHGCENSANTGGARLYASGNTVPDTLVLHAVGELPSALTIFLQGNALIYETAVFGDGLRCAGGALKRLFVHNASGGTVVAPQGGDLSITARSAAAGDPIPPGGTRYYQTYYRDPNLSYCPAPQGNTFNSSNGLRVVW